MEARLCFLTILLSLSLLLLLGVRDHRGVEQLRETNAACVAERVAEGAPSWLAEEACR